MSAYITPKGQQSERGVFPAGFYEFTKNVALSSECPMKINIFASTRYKLFVNGEYVCEGPCRSSDFMRYYDTVVCDRFRKGNNKIQVLVAHILEQSSFTSAFKKLKPYLIMRAVSDTDTVETDSSWDCRFLKNRTLIDNDTFVFPYEKICGAERSERVPLEEFRTFDFDNGYFAEWGDLPFRMVEREIPLIYPKEPVHFRVIKKGNNFIELDAGLYVTANVTVSLAPHTDTKIIYAECYEFPDGKHIRDDASGNICGRYDIISSGEKELTYESFWYRAFRFIRIECDTPENILSVEAKRYNYPIDEKGTFSCSDKNFEKMWDISRNTILCCASEILVDCPYYEQQQYVMDCAIETAVLLRMTDDTRLVRKCIDEFASSQQPCGLICANYPSASMQLIPGFSFFWLFMLKDYLEYSGDVAFAKKYTGTIDKLLLYFEQIKTPDGFFTRTREWDFVDWVADWDKTGVPPVSKGQPNTIYQLYLAYGLLCASYITEKCGRTSLANEYTARYNKLKEDINSKLFVSEKGMFHDGGGTFSMHTIIWAVIADIVTGKEAEKMLLKINDESISKSSYAMNFYLFRAFEKCGMYEKAAEYFGGWQKMIDLHCTTWCENPDNPRSECHGWSSAPLYEFSANVLGVKFSFDNEIIISPHTLGLEYAKGTVPTRHGTVGIYWKTENGKFDIQISSPDNVKKRLIMPDKTEYEFFEGTKHITQNM